MIKNNSNWVYNLTFIIMNLTEELELVFTAVVKDQDRPEIRTDYKY